MKINKIDCCYVCPGRMFCWCTIARQTQSGKRKIQNQGIIPTFCPLSKYKNTKLRIWKVKCCKDCTFRRTSVVVGYTNKFSIVPYYCGNKSDKDIKNPNKISSWCPLEDYKERNNE